MHGNNHKRKFSIKPEDNPYINDKLYPITLVLTSSIMDNYIGQVFTPYGGSFEFDTTPTIQESYEDQTKEIQTIGDLFGQIMTNLNDNNLNGIREIYDIFNEEYENVIKEENIEKHKEIINSPEFKKESFIQFLHKQLYEPINERLKKYNSTHPGSFILFNTSELVAIHKTKGLIVKNNTTLNNTEADIIRSSIESIFKSVFLQFPNSKVAHSDILLVEYIHLISGFKNRPFGLLFTDNRSASLFGNCDFYNSDEVRELIDQGIMDTYYKTLDMNDIDLRAYNTKHFGLKPGYNSNIDDEDDSDDDDED